MSNREEPLTKDELVKDEIICSDEDAAKYEEVVQEVRDMDTMRRLGKGNLDEGRNDEKKDLSYIGRTIPEIGLRFIGPHAVGGRGSVWIAGQKPVDYVLSENPRKRRTSLEKEFKKIGYEKFVKKYDAGFENRVRAVKCLLEKQKGDGLSANRFIREGKLLKKIQHPYVSHAIYAEEYEIVSKMFLDRVPFASLRGRTAREEFEIGVSLTKVLAEINEMGFDHRDISPNNALAKKPQRSKDSQLTDEERYEAVLIDFGNASAPRVAELERASMSVEAITQQGKIEGTPAWMAPEVIDRGLGGYNKQFKHCSEVYSLAATLYGLFTGKKPVDLTEEEKAEVSGGSFQRAFKLASKIFDWSKGRIDFNITPIHLANPLIPDCGLNELLVDRCMAPNPKYRPASLRAVYNELLEIRRKLDSTKIDNAAVRCFRLPDYYDVTEIFDVNPRVDTQEVQISFSEKGKYDSTRMTKFEEKPVHTLQKEGDFVKNGILEDGGTSLQHSVDRVKELGEQDIEISEDQSIQHSIDALVRSDIEDDFFADLNAAIEAGDDSGAINTLIMASAEQAKAKRKDEYKFSLAKRSEQSLVKYTPKKWGPKSLPHTKFHKK